MSSGIQILFGRAVLLLTNARRLHIVYNVFMGVIAQRIRVGRIINLAYLLFGVAAVVVLPLYFWAVFTQPHQWNGAFLATNIIRPLGNLILIGIILWRRGHEPFAVVTASLLLGAGLYEASFVDFQTNAHYPGLDALIATFFAITAGYVLFTFPDGSFISRRIALAYWGVVTPLGVLNLIVPLSDPTTTAGLFGFVFTLAALFAGITHQIVRYRLTLSAVERQQAKWVAYGVSLNVLGAMFYLFSDVYPVLPRILYAENSIQRVAISLISQFALPVSIVIGIVRYRLWDIDVIIRRTLLYTTLTVVLGLTYVVTVTLVQSAVATVSGQSSTIAIVVSTLVVAALFNPLRLQLQGMLERRFYRRNYDAARTLQQFAEKARDEVDVDRLWAELLAVIQETMHPKHLSIWVKGDHPASDLSRHSQRPDDHIPSDKHVAKRTVGDVDPD